MGRFPVEVPMRAWFRGVVFAAAMLSIAGCSSGYHSTLEASAAAPDARLAQRIAEARDAQAEALARLGDARSQLPQHAGSDALASTASLAAAAARADAAVWEMRRAAGSVRDMAERVAASGDDPETSAAATRVIALLRLAETAAIQAVEAIGAAASPPAGAAPDQASLARADAELAEAAVAIERSIAESDRFLASAGPAADR